MRINSKHIILFFLISFQLISAIELKGQTGFRSEGEMKSKAADYFAADQFDLAFPLYSQLLSLNPRSPELNYRFGVCLMYTERNNTEKPIPYLEKAINKITEIDLYYHLAVAYHSNYFFTDAMYNYRKYLLLAKNKARKDYEVNRKIAMCQNGMEMLRAANDIFVMQKSDVSRKSFYRSYDLLGFNGRILNLPDEFLSKADLKNKEEKITFFDSKAKLLFYAVENKNQKDIYYRIRQSDGGWSEAIILDHNINTTYDEDYPFLLPDGKTLYFSSKGHNTMGGFDIFQSVYDSLSNSWSKPINLSFPFNTPSDEILFISNADETQAWFASDRNSVKDNISVYKVGIIKKELLPTDLSDAYEKEDLSSEDLGRIKNMALLDINITDKEFQEIPIDKKIKLDALKKNESSRITQNIHQVNLKNIDKQITVNEIQTNLSDSIQNVIKQIDSKLESLKALYLNTQDLITAKTSVIQVGHKEVLFLLDKARKATLLERKKELISGANKILFKTLRHDFQNNKLKTIKDAINNQISAQRSLFAQANSIFGDIQKNIVNRNDVETRINTLSLNRLILDADTMMDYNRIIDYSKGALFYPNYPANLLNESSFAYYYLKNENDFRSAILNHKSNSSTLPLGDKKTYSQEFLSKINEKVEDALSKNENYTYQLKQLEELLNAKRENASQLLKEANYLIRAFDSRPTQDLLASINFKSADARRAAFEAFKAQEAYEQLKSTSSSSEKIADELIRLKNEIEALNKNGKNSQALDLKTRVDELESQGNQLPNFENTIDFDRKELRELSYPASITNTNNYVEYFLFKNKLRRRSGIAYSYLSVNEMISSSFLLENEPSESDEDEMNLASTLQNEQVPTQIRSSLFNFKQKQINRLNELEQQSGLLTQKASDKLDASTATLLDFEHMLLQYNKGQINDSEQVLSKQKESQDLLYQSLAINSFIEKIDSIHLLTQKQKEEFNNQTFAIEEALLNNQPERAQILYRALEPTIDANFERIESMIHKWINTAIEDIPQQKTRANLAFESSQRLTDESIQLLMDAQEIRENTKNKSNAFKRRELAIEAKNKEVLAVQKQDQADKQLDRGTKVLEEIKRSEAMILLANEFSASDDLIANTIPIIKPEKRKSELNERLSAREKEVSFVQEPNEALLTKSSNPIFHLENIPKINDLIYYKTKKYKAQLLAEELDINKRETVLLLKQSNTLDGSEASENNEKIAQLRDEAKTLQVNSTQAFIQAAAIYSELSKKEKRQADKDNSENYSKDIQNHISQLHEEASLLREKAAEDEEDRKNFRRQADEKEQIAMYLVLEEYQIIAQQNGQNYRKNNLALDNLYYKNKNEQEKDLMQAIFDQIESHMIQAANKRFKAKGEGLSFALRKALFLDSFSDDSNGLDLQEEAIRMIRENDSEKMLAFQSTDKPFTSETHTSQKAFGETSSKIPIQNNEKLTSRASETTVNIENQRKFSGLGRNENLNIFPFVKLGVEPEGTMFCVQIAAVGGLKTTNNFLNVMELFALKDKKLYRYFSGRFTNLKSAIIRRNALRLQGYADAFIKSWKDGKTVSLFEAAGEVDASTLALLKATSISLPSKYRNINFSANDISQLNGVYYSVQIGVYSRPRSSAQLFDIKPIYHNRFENGNWAYFNGIYKSIFDAEKNKNSIQSKGVSDAFIVAFKEGEKVSLVKARKAIQHGDSPPKKEDIIILEDAALVVDKQLKAIISPSKTRVPNIVYKVQIGVFSHRISFDQKLSSLNDSKIPKVEYFINNAGKYVYTIGNFKSYEEAANFKTKQLRKVIKDAFIITFNNGKKIH